MPIGTPITKADINQKAGSIAHDTQIAFARLEEFKLFLDGKSAQNLVDEYGFDLNDANLLKSAIADLAQLATLYTGAANLAVAKDFRTFAKHLWGVSVI